MLCNNFNVLCYIAWGIKGVTKIKPFARTKKSHFFVRALSFPFGKREFLCIFSFCEKRRISHLVTS
ncbi:MAG: hypothetical protein A2007_01495 [Verrucomicrobia bacterium GWC2_42_7]|nr:MAG: hypothetical protein A2007_01495 [Verrucomicrobia bacterium GWC2_42_7]